VSFFFKTNVVVILSAYLIAIRVENAKFFAPQKRGKDLEKARH
jgi:hypothetical protein